MLEGLLTIYLRGVSARLGAKLLGLGDLEVENFGLTRLNNRGPIEKPIHSR